MEVQGPILILRPAVHVVSDIAAAAAANAAAANAAANAANANAAAAERKLERAGDHECDCARSAEQSDELHVAGLLE